MHSVARRPRPTWLAYFSLLLYNIFQRPFRDTFATFRYYGIGLLRFAQSNQNPCARFQLLLVCRCWSLSCDHGLHCSNELM